MKKLYSLSAILFFALTIKAQAPFWTEDFGTGCSQGNLASAYTGTNGAWTVTATGTNDTYANMWYVSATEAGMGVGNCGSGCGTNSALTNRTLHLGSIAISALSLPVDPGASYNAGGVCGFGYCVVTNTRAESPAINCTGKTGITLAFNYFENGDGTNDDATLWYYDGTTWSLLQNVAKTPLGNCSPQGKWTAYSIALPASANNNANVKIGFNWVNNDDGAGTDPSFAVDDITLAVSPNAIATYTSAGISVFSQGNGMIHITTGGQVYKVIGVYDMLGQEAKFTQADNSIQLGEATPGIYIVTLEVNGVRVVRKLMMN